MRIANVLVLTLLLAAGAAQAATLTSAFADFTYSYTVTPEAGEDLRSFHVYTSLAECDVNHYYSIVAPAGWQFTTTPLDDRCVLTFYTEGDALLADTTYDFGFVHYCAPCCHSGFVGDEGSADPLATPVDDDSQHAEPCNIPAEFGAECGGPGLLLAPIYPVAIPNETGSWGSLKANYR